MINSKNFDPSAVHKVETEKFENAVELTAEGRFENVNYEDDYFFGPANSGLNTLTETYTKVGGSFTVLDVGYGNGVFLRETAYRYPKSQRLGITAVYCGENIDATLLSGDIERVETWKPNIGQLPEDRSVDVAVSHLTFTHIANPINGLANILRLMKPDGMLFIDHLRLCADSSDFDALEKALYETLVGHVNDLRIGSTEKWNKGQVILDFPVFTEGLDSIDLGIFKPYVNEHGDIAFTV